MIRRIDNINQKALWEGCILAAIAHAIMVSEYPELYSEHSWDEMNYNMQDLAGCKGTITFFEGGLVAVFQSIEHINFKDYKLDNTIEFLKGADQKVIKIANEEALQYVLEDVEGNVIPVISSAFWATGDEIYSNLSWNEIIKNGGYILKNQLQPIDDAILSWSEYYDMNEEQMKLTKILHKRKLIAGNEEIKLTDEEKSILIRLYGDDLEECIESLSEIKIYF